MRHKKLSFDILSEHTMYLYDACIYDAPPPKDQLSKIRSLISEIIETELTPRQKELVLEHYFKSKTMTEIAEEQGLNKSTVSRILKTARERISHTLRFSAQHLLRDRLQAL